MGRLDERLQDVSLVETERAGHVADLRPQRELGQQIRPARDDLPPQVPAIDRAALRVAGAGHDVVVALLLHADELGDEFGLGGQARQGRHTDVMREIGVHDDHKVARDVLQAMDIGGAEAELASAWS